MAAEVLTHETFQFPDVYPSISITPRCLNFTSPLALTPKTPDVTRGARKPLGLEVAFLIGKTSAEHTHNDETTEARRNTAKGIKVASQTTIESSDTLPSTSPGSRSDSSGNSGGKKNIRTKYTPQQINTLEKVFTENPYPDSDEVEILAADIGVSEGKIRIWFQNKRARWRRRVQTSNQQQHQTQTSLTGMYPILSSSAYPGMPPSAYTAMPAFAYPAMPSNQMIDSINTHHAVGNMSQLVPQRSQIKTTNSSTDPSPSSSPASASTGSTSMHSREGPFNTHPTASSTASSGQFSGYSPIYQTSQSSEEIQKMNSHTTISSPSPAPVAHSLQQMVTSYQSMMPFYPHLPQYPPYYPYGYSNFPGYY